ncbi:MAG: hypothetical protein KQA41_03435 [Candidatus Aenigmarchaeota archaeon]|nr:hypothetical protein [Candidatus Aenigmarchaeota archaeon]
MRNQRQIVFLSITLILAFSLTLYPHFQYPYPFHVDEWFHIAEAKMILKSSPINWFDNKPFKLSMEPAWHFLLASFQAFNLEATHWVFLPALLHIISILSVYACTTKLLGKKQALIASMLTALLPTNPTMGGPAYLIPVNLSLIFIPIAIRAVKEDKLPIVFSSLLFLLLAHPPSAMVLLIYLFFNFLTTKNKQLIPIVFLAILLSLPNYYVELKKGIEALKFDFWITLRQLPYIYGYIQTAFFIAGFYLILKTKHKDLAFTSMFLIFLIVLHARLGQTFLVPYIRIYIPLMLFMNIIASYSITKLPKSIMIASLIIILALSVNSILKQQHYRIIDSTDYKNFLWIRNNLQGKAILDPWKARAFVFIAERPVYVVMPFGPVESELQKVREANAFLDTNCTNTNFLKENRISIIYSLKNCTLEKVNDNTYFYNTIS